MQSSLTWVDHDSVAREKSFQIIDMFKERDSRDELGLGTIRDSFSDKLFPGTSTIQTRLRYMLIIPWMFQRLEIKRIPSHEIEAQARRLELQLIRPLADSEDSLGVFGAGVGQGLKRLPSEVYWSGLKEWGIRRFEGSISDYFKEWDQRNWKRDHRGDVGTNSMASMWHPRLPNPPEGFPGELSLSLTKEEAEFLRYTIGTVVGESLLGWLAREGRLARARRPWEHPDLARFPESIKALLEHARLFSDVMRGAAILYNLALAELAGRKGLTEKHRAGITDWAADLDRVAVSEWVLQDLWLTTGDPHHKITIEARRFVENWVRFVREDPGGLADNMDARHLVEMRERRIKRRHSRFVNVRAREQWRGKSGIQPMTFRWKIAKQFLEDLAQGLQAG